MGQIVKLILLALFNAIFGYMAYIAFLGNQMVIGGVISAVILVADFVFLNPRFVAGKFLMPGLTLMAIFVIVPIAYTILMSGFNYKTGNEITKQEAIVQLLGNGLSEDASGSTYDMVLGKKDGKLAALLTEQTSHQVLLGEGDTATVLAEGDYTLNKDGIANSTNGFTEISADEAANLEDKIMSLKFSDGNGKFIAAQATDTAALMYQPLSLSSDQKTLTNSELGVTYTDNGNGNFVSDADGTVLYPGWREFNPAQNYIGLLTDPVISGPFLSVFIWTITFAFVTVLIMFFAGLALAIALDKKIKGRNFYRAILILPYAIPSFMSILIWNGMFNRQYGAVNAAIGMQIDWYNDPFLAKVVILIVNLWLGFPYFYLIATGALQALPSDVQEAAEIDGANGRQIFRLIKLPLLLQILSPLLIASFAFNFNNFNLIYLLTGGGPTNVLAGETAGATDILITYAYKTAFGSAEQNLGLASAISVIMFLIVGALSMWSLRRSKVLEEL
jgi:arabinogalactan oligomer/maltooligosaccharide transport system permease protein